MHIKTTKPVQMWLMNMPFFIMLFFGIAHLMVYVQLDVLGKHLSFSFVNQIASMAYLASVYLWALLASKKRFVQISALFMGALSVCCILVSLGNMGNSINDALCTGNAVLTVLYVFENAQYLLELIKKHDKLLTGSIWGFVVFSIILFLFFQNRQTQWGEGTYFFGHRYASVCGMAMILIALKLLNRPKNAVVYWIFLLLSYGICFWTGARVYVLSGLGTFYAVLFTFRKNNRDFIIKCIAVTLVAVFLFFSSSTVTKNLNTVQSLNISTSTNADTVINSLSNGRPFMWNNCVESYKDLPLLNKLIGSGNKYIYDHNIGLHSHMDYLNILHFHGLVGFFAYLYVFIGYVGRFWHKNHLPVILLIGFWGIWFIIAFLNGYVSYSANMMTVPYLAVMANWEKGNIQSEE